jgi:hypothetical protein
MILVIALVLTVIEVPFRASGNPIGLPLRLFQFSGNEVTVKVKVSQGIDDGFRTVRWQVSDSSSEWYEISRDTICIDAGKEYGLMDEKQSVHDSWWLFRNLTVPQGSRILSATISWTCSAVGHTASCNTKILAEASDNPSPIKGEYWAGYFDFENRPKTSAVVLWHNMPPWYEGNRYTSPDISPVVQEVVNRDGWRSGNNMQIFWMDDGSPSSTKSACRSGAGYEYPLAPGNGEKAAELTITYSNESPRYYVAFLWYEVMVFEFWYAAFGMAFLLNLAATSGFWIMSLITAGTAK